MATRKTREKATRWQRVTNERRRGKRRTKIYGSSEKIFRGNSIYIYIYIFDVLFHFDAGSNILIIVALEKMNNRRNLTNRSHLSFILVKIFI